MQTFKKYSIVLLAILLFLAIAYANFSTIKDYIIRNFLHQTQKEITNEITNKKDCTLDIAITMSYMNDVHGILRGRLQSRVLYDLPKLFRRYSSYKNLWIELIYSDGKVVFRSWSGRIEKARKVALAPFLQKRGYGADIIIDCYGLHIASIAKVQEGSDVLGYVLILTQFNSIKKNLHKLGTQAIVLLDKKYIKKAGLVSKISLDSYLVMDKTLPHPLMEKIQRVGVEKILQSKSYVKYDGAIFSSYPLKNRSGETLGWIIVSKRENEILSGFFSADILLRIIVIALIFATILIIIIHKYTRLRQKAIEEKVDYYSKILDSLQEIVVITDGETLKYANKIFFKYFDEYENLEQFLQEHQCICDFFVKEEGFLAPLENGKRWTHYLIEHAGKNFLVKVQYKKREYIFQVKAEKIQKGEYSVIFVDITQQYRQTHKLKNMAIKDPLTGLYNRTLLKEIVQTKIEEAKRERCDLLVALIDIDYFKKINDLYGHDVGDSVLKELASMIKKEFRRSDPVFRIGGEEFMVVFLTKSKERILELLEDLRKRVENNRFDHLDRKITISIGVAQYRQGDSFETLYKKSDIALYRSKEKGRNTITFIGERSD